MDCDGVERQDRATVLQRDVPRDVMCPRDVQRLPKCLGFARVNARSVRNNCSYG